MPGQSVLIIQENPRERMECVEVMENLGFGVDVAMDGATAFQYVKSNQYSMVIADMDTPDFSGPGFLRQAKEKDAGTQVLFIASDPVVEDAVEVMREGALDFLVKPVLREQIELCAAHVFRESQPPAASSKRSRGSDGNVRIIFRNREMERLLKLAERIADSSATVLIQGESGTGKELFARYIHEKSKRREMPFVAVNCAALPESLLESELFGHEKGAFTGALSRKAGKFERAHTGTIFLDEITELQFHLQAKLLRVLQEKCIDRVGGGDPVDVDVRVVATTNRDVKEAMENGEFREDLFYRLNTIPLHIPPLRDRLDDLELLAAYFIEKYSRIDGRDVSGLTPRAMQILSAQPFNGNVRELENILHRAVLLAEGTLIEPEDLMLEADAESPRAGDASSGFPFQMEPAPLREMEEKLIFHTLDRTDGNRTHAAKLLGISVRTLRNKLNEYKK